MTDYEDSLLHSTQLGTLIRVILLGSMGLIAHNKEIQSKECIAFASLVNEMYPDFAMVAAEYFNSKNASSTLQTLKSMVPDDNILDILPLDGLSLSLFLAGHVVSSVAYVGQLADQILDGNFLPSNFRQEFSHLYSLTL